MTKENQRKEKTIIGSLAGIMAVITLVTIFAVVILRQTAARQQKEELAAQAAVQQTVEEQKEQTPQVQTMQAQAEPVQLPQQMKAAQVQPGREFLTALDNPYVSEIDEEQTAEEIDRMMDMTAPDKFALLYDTGHLAYCGQDYLAVLKKYAKRIAHVHLKDIRPEVVEKVKKEKLSFLQGVREGAFTVPGDGCIDFAPLFDELDKSGYEGWMIVEAEQDPAKANPLEYALKARDYIRKTAKI